MSRTTWKQRLAVFAGHVQEMYNHITTMPDDELRKLQAACKKAGRANCGWTTHAAARFIEADVNTERLRRRFDRRKRRAQPQEAPK